MIGIFSRAFSYLKDFAIDNYNPVDFLSYCCFSLNGFNELFILF